MTPIVFQGHGSKFKVSLVHLYTKACKQDTKNVQAEPLGLGQSNLVHILVMTRE